MQNMYMLHLADPKISDLQKLVDGFAYGSSRQIIFDQSCIGILEKKLHKNQFSNTVLVHKTVKKPFTHVYKDVCEKTQTQLLL